MSLFISCQGEASAPGEQYLPARNLLNIAYGKDSMQRLDAYLPEGRNPDSTRSIILIHGGGWNGGSRAEFNPYLDTFKTRLPGYAIFNISYRLVGNGHLFPTQELDVKAAIDHIAANAKEYGVSEDEFVLFGISAGGHLALLQAYKYNNPSIKAVIDFFGPTDLTAMYQRPWHPLVPYAMQMVTGTTPAANPDIYRNSSPINFVKKKSPPTLILHGTSDQVVNISQSHALKNRLDKEGVVNELVEYKGLGHGWRGPQMSHSFNRIQEFIQKHVR